MCRKVFWCCTAVCACARVCLRVSVARQERKGRVRAWGSQASAPIVLDLLHGAAALFERMDGGGLKSARGENELQSATSIDPSHTSTATRRERCMCAYRSLRASTSSAIHLGTSRGTRAGAAPGEKMQVPPAYTGSTGTGAQIMYTNCYTHLSLQMRPTDFDSTRMPKICTVQCRCACRFHSPTAMRRPPISGAQASLVTASATATLVLLPSYHASKRRHDAPRRRKRNAQN